MPFAHARTAHRPPSGAATMRRARREGRADVDRQIGRNHIEPMPASTGVHCGECNEHGPRLRLGSRGPRNQTLAAPGLHHRRHHATIDQRVWQHVVVWMAPPSITEAFRTRDLSNARSSVRSLFLVKRGPDRSKDMQEFSLGPLLKYSCRSRSFLPATCPTRRGQYPPRRKPSVNHGRPGKLLRQGLDWVLLATRSSLRLQPRRLAECRR
jgi:hypothetical protein